MYRILALEKLGAVFNQVATPLQYTPRRFVIHPESSNLIVIETDHNAYTDSFKQRRKQQMAEVCCLLIVKSRPLAALVDKLQAQIMCQKPGKTLILMDKPRVYFVDVVKCVNEVCSQMTHLALLTA